MATVKTTLTLTERDRSWMDNLIEQGEFVSASEYVRALIRKDQEFREDNDEYLRRKIKRALEGESVELTRDELLSEVKRGLKIGG